MWNRDRFNAKLTWWVPPLLDHIQLHLKSRLGFPRDCS